MPYYRTSIYSGDVLEVEQYFSPRAAGKNIPRGINRHLTSELQKERNKQNARKNLSRLINANFGKGDIFATLTYAGSQPTEEQAQKDMKKFVRRIRNDRRRKGLPELKYIWVTEGLEEAADHRIHHHIIMSAMSLDDVMKFWEHGRAIVSRLDPDGDYTGLANYITKQSSRGEHKKRWSQSRNLKKPVYVRKEIKRGRTLLKAPKGYKIIQQELYASDTTGEIQYIKAIRIGGADYSQSRVAKAI